MKKKILITGGSGLLGQYLNISAKNDFEIFTLHNTNKGNCIDFKTLKVDIRDPVSLKKVFEYFKPNIVIHSAAITNPVPNQNQTGKDYFETNVKATQFFAEFCEMHNAKLIYISTDLVYAGYRGPFHKEKGKLIPVTLYAETKLMGEVKIRQILQNHLILRTALLYGIGLNHSQCHFQKMKENFNAGKSVKLFTNQFRTPISLKDASKIIVELANTDLKNETINLGGSERLSRYEMGEVLCNIAGFDKNLIEKITMDDLPDFPKVEDVSLNTEKLKSLGFRPGTYEEYVNLILEEK
jgi:dTDP-4-dehydrorhamnose reductase